MAFGVVRPAFHLLQPDSPMPPPAPPARVMLGIFRPIFASLASWPVLLTAVERSLRAWP
ncbi:hypothetical protein CLJ1_2017 [Pseudomonas paraeruginosa]|nr:hypothetical protein CLJ1_2017 [Pseudomonas aeruginosa]